MEINNDTNDSTAQSFGIDSININIKGASFIPQININFIDVRGKTLFESPQNSPYGAFFHLPWPIFYLTIKGYYGKAIRYRLHLTKFSSKYNESNGNFEIATTFVGSTYAFLNDIPLNGILNAPYMYMVESDSLPAKFNEKKGVSEKQIKKSSKGYVMLKSVYDEYKQKGLIDKNFPTKTLRELIVVARSLDKLLEKEIFGGLVDMKLFVGIKDFEKKLTDFEATVQNWSKRNLSAETVEVNGAIYNKMANRSTNFSDDLIKGTKKNGTLESIITNYPLDLKDTKIFTETFLKQAANNFKKETFSYSNKIKPIDSYVKLTSEGTFELFNYQFSEANQLLVDSIKPFILFEIVDVESCNEMQIAFPTEKLNNVKSLEDMIFDSKSEWVNAGCPVSTFAEEQYSDRNY